MSLRRHAVTLLAALVLAAVAPRLYAQARIAVVDLQRALNETEDGRRAKAKLKKIFDRRQRALNKAQNELKQLKEEIESQIEVWDAATKQKKLRVYQEKLVALQEEYVQYQRELAQMEARLTRNILARMERILRRIGQAEGYTLILERNEGGVVFVPGNLDLTDLVIQRYNAGEGREGGSGGRSKTKTKRRRRPSSD